MCGVPVTLRVTRSLEAQGERYAAGRQAGHGVGCGEGTAHGLPPAGRRRPVCAHPLTQGTAVLGATNPAAGEVSANVPTLLLGR